VRATSRRGAQVVVVAKAVPAGSSELGLTDVRFRGDSIISAYVGLKPSHDDPYQVALTATHEFGHVLGLDHEDRGCSIMNSRLRVDHPYRCVAPPAGKWWCRLLAADDVAGAIALYGGHTVELKRPAYCTRGER
jgi:hypothetical protein